ncbi:CCZ1B [Branchiostoma lanceolatum]|uniref:CCZ1B protein n=1 Tax=Branchiostoma lanceolatum TaxID=7740 RepID=A0A8K0ADJ5_BRALA|nr:CCZ1B [Branchiostoma lanceolatum]
MPSTKLENFFIYNSNFGPREGEEHKKILFYHPPDVLLDNKIKQMGLCEAIVTFTHTFSPDHPCEALHTQKTRQLFYQPEKDFWMIMTVTIPCNEKTGKDGQTYIEYHDEDVQDSVFDAVLKTSYKMFRLFMGTFTRILERFNVEVLKQRLEHFFLRYLGTLRLATSDILDVFNGIHFLPLDKNMYLRIQCFINLTEATFGQVKYTAFLYNDQLVWSGLEQDDMRILYKYLTTSLFPSALESELGGKESPKGAAPTPVGGSAHYGRYITGPPDMKDPTNLGKVPRIYVNTETSYEELYLIVYRALSATICLMVDASVAPSFDLYQKLDSFIGPQLSSLGSDISEQYAKKASSSDPVFKYIYFNHMNLATKSTVHTKKSATTSLTNISPDIMRILGDINADFYRHGASRAEEDGETIMKTMSDCWVVGKKSDQREFYVVLNQKNANLIEINEEVKKLCATNFNNIFFLD